MRNATEKFGILLLLQIPCKIGRCSAAAAPYMMKLTRCVDSISQIKMLGNLGCVRKVVSDRPDHFAHYRTLCVIILRKPSGIRLPPKITCYGFLRPPNYSSNGLCSETDPSDQPSQLISERNGCNWTKLRPNSDQFSNAP